MQEDEDDLRSAAAPAAAPKAPGARGARAAAAAPTESQLAITEVIGQVLPDGAGGEAAPGALGLHDEVGADGAESAEEYAEASVEQLNAAPTEESAFADLRGVEGFEESAAEESAEARAAAPALLPDAGAAAYGGEEFLPIVASLASTVLPTLASRIGPTIARGVARRLSSAAKSALQRRRRGGGLLSVIGKLLESAEQQPVQAFGESALEAEAEALVEETVQMLEVIIGTDDRVRITKTTSVPWRRICALRIHMPSGATYRGTGFLIGRRAVATAGHCVYLHNQGGWARRIEVIPGANGTQRPLGQAVATTFRSVRGWVQDRRPESDYGCILVPPGSFGGHQIGNFGVDALSSAELLARRAVLAGYPGDKPFAEMWGMGRRLKAVTATQLVYEIDTMGGQSGAPVYVKRNNQRIVVGIHNYGASSGNSATRITGPVLRNLQRWSKL